MVDRRLSLSWHTISDVMVIRVETSLLSSALDKDMASARLGELGDQSNGKIVMDMSAMEMLDSRMLAAMVSLHRKLETKGGELRLCQVTPSVMKIFDTLGLPKIMKIDETEEESIAVLRREGRN
jgi:anti-anti-sigma factor